MADEKKTLKREDQKTLSIGPEAFADLERLKAAKEKQLGINLSWNDYFLIDIKERKGGK